MSSSTNNSSSAFATLCEVTNLRVNDLREFEGFQISSVSQGEHVAVALIMNIFQITNETEWINK